MPRKSPFPIVLRIDERKKLEAVVRGYTSPYYYIMRAKIALYASQGMENKEIGQKLDLPRQIVSKWRKRFFESRLAGLEDEPRTGRPPVFSPSHSSRNKSTGV